MKKLFFSLLCLGLISLAFAKNSITVEAFDEQGNNPGQISLRLRLANETADTLSNVRVRYFLNYEQNRVLKISPYYIAGASVSLDTLGNSIVLNMDFLKVAPGVFPNTSGICIGMNYAGYEDFHKEKNFSYPGTENFSLSENIPVYVNGSLFAGHASIEKEISKRLRFVGIQPENTSARSAWIELENEGISSVDLKKFYLKQVLGDSLNFKSFAIEAGKRIRICFSDDSSKCALSDMILPKFSFGLEGTLKIITDSTTVDSIELGKCGQVMQACLRTVNDSSVFGIRRVYESGDFFRYLKGIGWNLY